MSQAKIGIFGARSVVGRHLFSLLKKKSFSIAAFSRKPIEQSLTHEPDVEWLQIRNPSEVPVRESISTWVSLAPIWSLPNYFILLEAYRVRRIIAVSSTSRFSKENSNDPSEQTLSLQLKSGEDRLIQWAESRGVEWVILRPTIIYGNKEDKNISEIVRIIRLLGFFPLLGRAAGLRQPIHAEDVAQACLDALMSEKARNKAYNISGAEVLSYRDMVKRIFAMLEKKSFLITVPLWFFRLAVSLIRRIPRYRKWTTAMAERMNSDLVFDHVEARNDFNFKSRRFILNKSDYAES